MKHSNKPSVSGISNETFLKTESASSLQGSAEPNSPDTSISNGSETYPHKIDALKNWFRTRPIVEKFCALPTYIQSWGLTLFFMGTATIIAFCFFHALKNPTANIALTYIDVYKRQASEDLQPPVWFYILSAFRMPPFQPHRQPLSQAHRGPPDTLSPRLLPSYI